VRINPEALRTIRTDRDVKLNELAALVGCQPSHLCNVEAGRREASPKLIRALAAALHIPLLSILGPEDRTEAMSA
jgi:transcriptional regulator with XRE-family HTH domain